jgi:cupin 2 domain-containing protein
MAEPATGNVFAHADGPLTEERVDILAKGLGMRVERIISRGQRSPDGFWYDQADTEFVVLLSGSAIVRFETPARDVALQPGDWLDIPAHCRHRVEATASDADTVWLAVHRAL